MNDTDENAEAIKRVNDKLGVAGRSPPHASLLAPASLYLTAILEYVYIEGLFGVDLTSRILDICASELCHLQCTADYAEPG